MNLWIQRPIGLLASLLLLAAMVATSVPTGKVHAHADADHGHGHSVRVAGDGSSDQDDQPYPSEPAGLALHEHDVGTTVPALFKFPALAFSVIVHLAPEVRMVVTPAPTGDRIPPHRPPIA